MARAPGVEDLCALMVSAQTKADTTARQVATLLNRHHGMSEKVDGVVATQQWLRAEVAAIRTRSDSIARAQARVEHAVVRVAVTVEWYVAVTGVWLCLAKLHDICAAW